MIQLSKIKMLIKRTGEWFFVSVISFYGGIALYEPKLNFEPHFIFNTQRINDEAKRIEVDNKTIKLAPPEVLLEPTPMPILQGNTNEDLVNLIIDLKAAVQTCNIDKQTARESVKK